MPSGEPSVPASRVPPPSSAPSAGDAEQIVEGPRAAVDHPKLRVDNLSFYYGKFKALHDISFEVPDRQVSALIGPSGCGKSTLLRTFNRIFGLYSDQRVEGRILLDDQNLLDPAVDPNLLRSRIGMVFQKPTPFPMSVFDNIAFGVRLFERLSRADLAARVEWALRQAAIWDEVKDVLRRTGTSLSGGQQQRLCIARAVASKPEVLLLDEPASALDPISTQKIEELLIELKHDYTVVIVTHNLQEAARIADYTAFMYLGHLVEYDRTAKIFAGAAVERTRDYVRGRYG